MSHVSFLSLDLATRDVVQRAAMCVVEYDLPDREECFSGLRAAWHDVSIGNGVTELDANGKADRLDHAWDVVKLIGARDDVKSGRAHTLLFRPTLDIG